MSRDLEALIRAEIARAGPITFARFMELALYHPRLGYYRVARQRTTRDGDYLTAPELHPIFGRVMSRQIEEVWRLLGEPAPFTVSEYGPGAGSLGLVIARELSRRAPRLFEVLHYWPIELNRYRRREVTRAWRQVGFADRLVGTEGPANRGFTGCILANEFLDALPVHRFEWRAGRLVELLVESHEGGFRDVAGSPTTPLGAVRWAASRLEPRDGQVFEVCPGISMWIAEVAEHLDRGYVLISDYGDRFDQLYASERDGGTLRTYKDQAVGRDPYDRVGERDLSAHVDFSAVEDAAVTAGLSVLGLTRQAQFLMWAGLQAVFEEYRSDPLTDPGDYLVARSAVRRLLDPRLLGGFKVLVLGRDVPANPLPAGLRDPRPSR